MSNLTRFFLMYTEAPEPQTMNRVLELFTFPLVVRNMFVLRLHDMHVPKFKDFKNMFHDT